MTKTELMGLQFGSAGNLINELFNDEVERWMSSTGKVFNPNLEVKGMDKTLREIVFSAYPKMTLNKMQDVLKWAIISVSLPKDEHYMSAVYITKTFAAYHTAFPEQKSTSVKEKEISPQERDKRDRDTLRWWYESYKRSEPMLGIVSCYKLLVKRGLIPDNHLQYETRAKAKAQRLMSEKVQEARDNNDRWTVRRLNVIGAFDPIDVLSISKEMAVFEYFDKLIDKELENETDTKTAS